MSKARGHQTGAVLKFKPPTGMRVPVRDFDLPDGTFWHLKHERLKQNTQTASKSIRCELVGSCGSRVSLECIEVIPCPAGAGKVLCLC